MAEIRISLTEQQQVLKKASTSCVSYIPVSTGVSSMRHAPPRSLRARAHQGKLPVGADPRAVRCGGWAFWTRA